MTKRKTKREPQPLSEKLLELARTLRRFEKSPRRDYVAIASEAEDALHRLRRSRDKRVTALQLKHDEQFRRELSKINSDKEELRAEIERRKTQNDDLLEWVLFMALDCTQEKARNMTKDEIIKLVSARFPHEPGGNGKVLYSISRSAQAKTNTASGTEPL